MMRLERHTLWRDIGLAAFLALSPPALAQQTNAVQPQPTVAVDGDSNGTAPKIAEPAMPDAPIVTQAGGPSRSSNELHELSPLSMFLNADILVKAVMISLGFASFLTWTIFLAKSFELAAARNRLRKALVAVAAARSLSEAQLLLCNQRNVLSSLLAVADQEAKFSSDCLNDSGIKERAASSFSEVVRFEARAIRRGTGLLATIGATAPFVGLFGTVWGIMNSFIGISKSQTTNLAVVAPGIAEALLATATGLVAAIPAVIIYNHFSRATKGYLDLVGGASGMAGRLLSRDLDRRHVNSSTANAAE
jgi:biopolymer transport protein ExbB